MISVLFIDDEPQLLDLAKFFIQRVGKDIGIDSAASAREADGMMSAHPYDALVCDYQMPEMDGVQFLKQLRNQKNDIPFILFTGKGREDVAIQALNSGADFYLQKGGDPNSQFAELVSMIRTSVAARKAERSLARNEKLFRLMAENSRDLVYRYSMVPEPHFEYVSPSATAIVGYTPDEHYSNPALGMELVHPDDRQTLEDMMEGRVDPSKPIVVRWKTKDGRTIWTEQRIVQIRDDDGRVVAIEGTAIDITERREAEEKLRASEAHYRSVFETAGNPMVVLDAEGTIQSINSPFEKLFGYSKSELEGRTKWTMLVDPEQVKVIEDEYRSKMEDSDGGPKCQSISVKNRFGAEMALMVYASVVPGTNRTVVSLVDETDRRRYEDALQQVGKKMDLLARITRHDIMNQLAGLYGYLELAQERVNDPGVKGLLDKAHTASESIRRHLEFARDYQNMGTKRPQWIDVQAAFKRACSNIDHKEMRIVASLEGLEVFSDPMLEKVFYNLVDNTVKHGQKASGISVHYSHGPEGMRMIYEDSGVGVPPSEKEAIFERSTGDREGRRGYGLYLAREILSITGIKVSETGTHGEGARFELLVPRGKYRTKKAADDRKRGSRHERS